MVKYHTDCEKCGSTINETKNNSTIDILNYTVCDSCEATICINCISEFNECPVCGKEITKEDNF